MTKEIVVNGVYGDADLLGNRITGYNRKHYVFKNGRTSYEVYKINLVEDEEVVLSIESEDLINSDIHSIQFPVRPKMKRKIDLKEKDAFGISLGEKYSTFSDGIEAEFYIPISFLTELKVDNKRIYNGADRKKYISGIENFSYEDKTIYTFNFGGLPVRKEVGGKTYVIKDSMLKASEQYLQQIEDKLNNARKTLHELVEKREFDEEGNDITLYQIRNLLEDFDQNTDYETRVFSVLGTELEK